MDRDLTNTALGDLNVTVPGRTASHGHHFRVYCTGRSGENVNGLGIFSGGACKAIDGRTGLNTNACYYIAGTSWSRYGDHSGSAWTYDPDTNKEQPDSEVRPGATQPANERSRSGPGPAGSATSRAE